MKRREFLKGAGSAALLGSMLNTRSYADEPARLASRRVWCWAGTDQWMNGFLQTHGGEVMPESLPCPPVEWVDFFHCRNVNYQPEDVNRFDLSIFQIPPGPLALEFECLHGHGNGIHGASPIMRVVLVDVKVAIRNQIKSQV